MVYDDFIVAPADIDESTMSGERAKDYVLRVAVGKAKSIAERMNGAYVLGFDTVVAVGRRILRKALSEEEAFSQMTLLSGRRHRVYTGISIALPNGKIIKRVRDTVVVFKRISDMEKKEFVDSREWEGVAVYKSQGIAARFIKSINGLETNIQGLPVFDVYQMLCGAGVIKG
ncbi:Maf-like protein [Candidatus Hydrogenosomobacter endosymbioticus]|uniref:Maf-like protein n=1 Tax=Candidatus Hydrogenosomobacter endosymbioticus TaxID=2558174 RepID=A0ABM7V8S8_9PROT|nr:Maf-like protein [Candidatus Hydrogenosomobacter endosymbioticus]